MKAATAQLWLFDEPTPATGKASEPAPAAILRNTRGDRETVLIEPGQRANQEAIANSYSAQSLAEGGGKVRHPFPFRGAEWVCTGSSYHGPKRAHECYRIVPVDQFDGPGEPKSYAETDFQSDPEKRARFGGYHGMSAKNGSSAIVLVGPPVVFINAAEAADA